MAAITQPRGELWSFFFYVCACVIDLFFSNTRRSIPPGGQGILWESLAAGDCGGTTAGSLSSCLLKPRFIRSLKKKTQDLSAPLAIMGRRKTRPGELAAAGGDGEDRGVKAGRGVTEGGRRHTAVGPEHCKPDQSSASLPTPAPWRYIPSANIKRHNLSYLPPPSLLSSIFQNRGVFFRHRALLTPQSSCTTV